MAVFSLKDTDKYYLTLTEPPKRFDADSPVTNVFFDDTNGQVFTVRSGGVTGVTVNGMDDSKSTSFRMEDKGPIISIKFSPDHKILAIQRNLDGQIPSVEFVNFKDLIPTNIEYSHTCKWKTAKILGFVWPKVNEIAFITDHGIELLQIMPEKKQLKTLKSTSFSGAWFSWCAQSKIVVLAGNNGALLQPFSLGTSTITKLQKIELESSRPVVERDVFVLRLCDSTWCAVFRHGNTATSVSGPTEVWLMPISSGGTQHVLKTGLVGRFAVSVVDNLVIIHHQSSQTSQIFDIMEQCKVENKMAVHVPVVPGVSLKPAFIDEQPCPMYSGNWVVFQPHFIIDARLGCLWRVSLLPESLLHSVPRDEIAKVIGVLLRLEHGKQAIYLALNQLVSDAGVYLVELGQVFDEINAVYRKWADAEVAKNTAGHVAEKSESFPVVISQSDMCSHVLQTHADDKHLVQVVTLYLSSLSAHELIVQHSVGELCVRTLVTRGAAGRLRSLVRRGCLDAQRPLACQLLSLGRLDPAAAQLALDMMRRLNAPPEIVEVLLSWDEPVSAAGAARQLGAWGSLSARKVLAAAQQHQHPAAFLAVYHALLLRNERTRGSPHFLKGEQCDVYIEHYKQLMTEE
ncbi:regulator of MON1-CCZ1 complex [Leptidea sinapis]|uniref:regulator of MON1-CCZ1 complex n=1 Tax=Leptidea sinapis TaxID=189913 RepID=UPI0021C46BDF|nr:regulator of MON1-CCZ1 complex [Leptidea sinapis]